MSLRISCYAWQTPTTVRATLGAELGALEIPLPPTIPEGSRRSSSRESRWPSERSLFPNSMLGDLTERGIPWRPSGRIVNGLVDHRRRKRFNGRRWWSPIPGLFPYLHHFPSVDPSLQRKTFETSVEKKKGGGKSSCPPLAKEKLSEGLYAPHGSTVRLPNTHNTPPGSRT